MKTLIAASALALSTLWFAVPARAALPPPLPAPANSFDAGSLHVDVYGTAGKPALVFIPGLTCGPWEWSGEISRFASNYRIYALTLPGFDGRAPISGPLFQTVSADFWSMLASHRIDRPVLVGHSLGGTLAIMLAEQHSNQLGGLVAVDGLPVFPGFEKMTPQQREQAGQRFSAMMAATSTPAQFEAAEKTYVLPNYLTSASDAEAIAPLVARSDPKASGVWMAQDVSSDTRPALKSITVPFLEIAPYDGTIDSGTFGTAQAKSAYYASLIAGDPSAKVAVIDHSRHFVMYDQPAQLDAALKTFLQGLQ